MNTIETFTKAKSVFEAKVEETTRVKPSLKGTILSPDEKKKAEKAARDFESLFIYLIFKEMRKAMLDKDSENNNLSDFGGDTFDDLGYLELSSQISKTGIGIGIAGKIYEQLTGEKLKVDLENKIEPKSQTKRSTTNPAINNKPKSEISTIGDNPYNRTLNKLFEKISQFDDWVNEASEKFNLPQSLIQGIIAVESAGNPNAISNAGAKGLMQLIDSTASYVGIKNVFNPQENIHGGAKYLREMLDMFGGNLDLALAAYNAGPGNVLKYNGIPPFRETQNYVQRVKRYTSHFTNNSQTNKVVNK